ncbi:MAG: HAMP domain-containing protein [Candidatus Cloacimonetes bacterium]|nr:HAMP domain-containing protein [Candidatus Cloacimonadota bacterium]
MKMQIRTKIIAGFVIVLVFMLFLSIYSVNVTERTLTNSVGESAIFLADEMMKRINREIISYIEQLELLSRDNTLQEFIIESNKEFEKLKNVEELIAKRNKQWNLSQSDDKIDFISKINKNKLSKLLRQKFIDFYREKYNYSIFSEIFVTNKFGVNVAQTGKTTDYEQSDEEWWQISKEKGLYLKYLEYDESGEGYVISIGIKVRDSNGNFIGVLKAAISGKYIARIAEFTIKKHKTAEIYLLTHNKDLIYSSNNNILKKESANPFSSLFDNIKGESGFFTLTVDDGKDKLFSYITSRGYGDFEGLSWILLVEHSVEEILEPVFSLRKKVIAVSAILILISIILAIIISHSISSPLKKLIKGVKIIGKGELNYKLDIDREDEIGHLAKKFNEMTENLREVTVSRDELDQEIKERKQAEEELKKYREHLEELVEERTEELKETQKQLMQREKLATLGKFAGGLAHEIKNPLAVIDSSLVYLQYQDYEDEKLLKHMERIRTSIKKADEIIDSLRRLSKIQKPEKTKLNINKLLQEISAETGISDKIELDLNLPEREIFINGDEVQLSLALKNIIKNAEEAIEDEGAIDIKLELLKSEKCKIIIRDTGKGIEDNELKQIFEPLYSTKSSGLGFGLSLVKQIIELHNGKLKVESNPGKGTKFKIVLPTT